MSPIGTKVRLQHGDHTCTIPTGHYGPAAPHSWLNSLGVRRACLVVATFFPRSRTSRVAGRFCPTDSRSRRLHLDVGGATCGQRQRYRKQLDSPGTRLAVLVGCGPSRGLKTGENDPTIGEP